MAFQRQEVTIILRVTIDAQISIFCCHRSFGRRTGWKKPGALCTEAQPFWTRCRSSPAVSAAEAYIALFRCPLRAYSREFMSGERFIHNTGVCLSIYRRVLAVEKLFLALWLKWTGAPVIDFVIIHRDGIQLLWKNVLKNWRQAAPFSPCGKTYDLLCVLQ
jgi:hypothetical protein